MKEYSEMKDRISNLDTVWKPIEGAGSDRRYSRLAGPDPDVPSVVRAESDDVTENRSFIGLARAFREYGVNIPEIYDVSDDEKTYYLEDLGSIDLFSLVGTDEFEPVAVEALQILARMQTAPREIWEPHVQHPQFSVRQVLFDLNYFKYSFLKLSGVVFDEERLQDEFERFATGLVDIPENELGFMYRDFQSRNVMVRNGEPWFIDFQGGRRGPVLYDAVSFLWQAKAALPDDMKTRLLSVYAGEYGRLTGVSPGVLLRRLPDLLIFRTLQVLGAYGMRGLTQRRAHFLQSIPSGLKNLRSLLESPRMNDFPELKRVAGELCSLERFAVPSAEDKRLHIKVMSFSYKKGYPDDFSGNGGGFMFDCRAMHNPGRYEAYKSLTGRAEPVIRFLEEREEVQKFLEAVALLVDPAVERYIARGFTSLQIGFGCTGGQHRSVYCAERTARRLHDLYPEAKVELIHREQKIREEL